MAIGSPTAVDAGSLAYMYPCCPAAEGLCPLPAGNRGSSGVGPVPYATPLKQNKRTHESEAGNDIPTQDDKPSTGWEDSLSLGKEVFQAHRHVAKRGFKGCAQEIAFSSGLHLGQVLIWARGRLKYKWADIVRKFSSPSSLLLA